MKQRPVLSAWPKANEPHTWQRVGYQGARTGTGARGGPAFALGRLPKGVSRERARCPRRHSDLTDIPDS